ncbi:MAG: class I SAM-dependent methyltransferase [Deltaproteobacteria bacterium]|nr:class I SAM-dependent methyltransferase [Deltaproteobacteria bacterium]
MDRKERIEEEFELGEEGEAVQEYEALTDNFLYITALLIADEVAQLVEGRAGVALDLGAGPGSLVREMATRLPQFLVIGLDISLPMAQRGRERVRAEGVQNVAFVVADVHRLPFKSKSLEVIVSHGSMHHWRRVDIALAEIKQVLAEKGFIYISDLRRDAHDAVVQKIAALLNERQARAFLNSVRAAYTIEELSSLVSEAGLVHIRVEPEDFSRRTVMQNMRELRKSPMRGMRQAAINLRLVGGGN